MENRLEAVLSLTAGLFSIGLERWVGSTFFFYLGVAIIAVEIVRLAIPLLRHALPPKPGSN